MGKIQFVCLIIQQLSYPTVKMGSSSEQKKPSVEGFNGKIPRGRINVVGISGECQILKKKGGFLGGFNLQKRN